MTRHRLAFFAALFALLPIATTADELSPVKYCAQHPEELKCKAYRGAASHAHSNAGNTGGRQNFEQPNNREGPR